MTTDRLLILLISFFLFDLAYSVPKLDRRREDTKTKRLWGRQGLPHSLESANEDTNNDPDDHDDGISDGNNQLEDYNDIQPNYDDQPPADYENEDLYTNDNDEYVGKDDMIGYHDEAKSTEYEDSNIISDHDSFEDDYAQMLLHAPTRAMQVGDTFAAQEMLPIALKLIKKLGKGRGKGHGIVSAAKHSKNLADTLFERYFMSMKRIVILKDIDLSGLDALQALALSGEVAGLRSAANSVTESPYNKRGETLLEENPIRKCHYKLLRKRIDGRKIRLSKRNAKRRRVDISKRLAKHRKLVLNPARRRPTNKNQKPYKINRKSRKRLNNLKKSNLRTNNRDHRTKVKQVQNHKTHGDKKEKNKNPKDECRWRYECTEQGLESCRLHIDCSQDVKLNNYIGFRLNAEEKTEPIKQFRRMAGIDVLDEEVEKILEKRFHQIRPQKLEPSEKVESLASYFNRIVIREQLENSFPEPIRAKLPYQMTPKPDVGSTFVDSEEIPPNNMDDVYGDDDDIGPIQDIENDEDENDDEQPQDDNESNEDEIEEEQPEDNNENNEYEIEEEQPGGDDKDEPDEEIENNENDDQESPDNEDEAAPENEDELSKDQEDDPPESEELTPETEYPEATDLGTPDDNTEDSPNQENGSLESHVVVLNSNRKIMPGIIATTNKPKKT